MTFVNARLTWLVADDRTEVALWGKNLTDEDDYLVGGVALVGFTGGGSVVYGEPRTFGIDIEYRFGKL